MAPKPMRPQLCYMICATPRSGSTLLCEALRNTELAGRPDEYFGPMHVARWNERWRTQAEQEYLEKVFEYGTGANDVWGVKVMRLYWRNFIEHLGRATGSPEMAEADLLSACFPNLRYIWMTRRDKVRQAISWLKFIQGAAWYWEDKEPQVLDGLEFRPDVIRGFLTQTAIHETAWLELFHRLAVRPHIVVYEDLVDQYEQTAKGVLDYLGVVYSEPLAFSPRRMRKQADALTEEWVQRVLTMYRGTESM